MAQFKSVTPLSLNLKSLSLAFSTASFGSCALRVIFNFCNKTLPLILIANILLCYLVAFVSAKSSLMRTSGNQASFGDHCMCAKY